jgi:hypothetical protein
MPSLQALLGTLGLGASLGFLHAFDADHLAAVSTMVADGASPRRSSTIGLLWGLGHAAALGAVGAVLLGVGGTLPPGLGPWLDLGVAAMLVGLGAGAVRRGIGAPVLHAHVHAHGGRVHAHRHLHVRRQHEHAGWLHALAHAGRRPFAVGVVHGLAGSGALTLLVLSATPSRAAGLLYLAVFGLGSIAGMWLVSALVGLPLAAARASHGALGRRLPAVVGAGSVVLGCALAGRALAAQGLLGG